MKKVLSVELIVMVLFSFIFIQSCTENGSKKLHQLKSNTEMLFLAEQQMPPPPPQISAKDSLDFSVSIDNNAQSVINASAEYKLDASELFNEWKNDCKFYSKKYQGSIIKLTGKAKWVGTMNYPRTFVIAVMCSDRTDDKIFCYFTQSQQAKVTEIVDNSVITIKGKCAFSCYLGTVHEDIRLINCTID